MTGAATDHLKPNASSIKSLPQSQPNMVLLSVLQDLFYSSFKIWYSRTNQPLSKNSIIVTTIVHILFLSVYLHVCNSLQHRRSVQTFARRWYLTTPWFCEPTDHAIIPISILAVNSLKAWKSGNVRWRARARIIAFKGIAIILFGLCESGLFQYSKP